MSTNFKTSVGLDGITVGFSAYNYQGDDKDVKLLNGELSISTTGFAAKLDVVNVGINSVGLKANLGFNTSTGVAISSSSVKANIGGFGVKVGKEIGFSTSIGGTSIDIGTLIDRSAGSRIREALAKNGINKEPALLAIVYLAKASGLNSKEGALTNNTKPEKEININIPIEDELSNVEDSSNTITGVACSNESLKDNITSNNMKVENETSINTSIARNIRDIINPITDVLNSNKNLDTNIINLVKTRVLNSKEGALTNTTDFNTKPEKEIDINISIEDELSNVEDSSNTITGVACSNESLKDNITSNDMKVENETSINMSIEDESRNIRDIINPIMDILNSDKNLDTKITDFVTKAMKEIDTNMHIADVPFNIEDLINAFTSVASSNESIMTNAFTSVASINESIMTNTFTSVASINESIMTNAFTSVASINESIMTNTFTSVASINESIMTNLKRLQC
ncbi:hypothetical protein C2G38_103477 [Gigaspora rosea]|uniref:Uncharacterized protein n=1 Tax=Gigaspora rosea TaxID=44941 RepID=A0A397UML4_9GLOM|nr:hypothetical protein C2G38_103477 [Gigaspora rosea]